MSTGPASQARAGRVAYRRAARCMYLPGPDVACGERIGWSGGDCYDNHSSQSRRVQLETRPSVTKGSP